jgi:hypothetical protein
VLGSGLIMDRHGGLYASDLEHGIVVSISRTPIHTLTTKVFVRDRSKLSWADGFAISPFVGGRVQEQLAALHGHDGHTSKVELRTSFISATRRSQ